MINGVAFIVAYSRLEHETGGLTKGEGRKSGGEKGASVAGSSGIISAPLSGEGLGFLIGLGFRPAVGSAMKCLS